MAMFNEDKNLKSGGCADEIAALIRDDLSPKMIQEQLENYHNSDIAKSMEQMDRLGRMRLIRSIEPDKLAGIFKYVEPQEAAAFLKDIDTARAVFILEKIDPDAAADILRKLPGSDRSAMIGLLNGALRKKIELLVSFDEDEIGSRMSANFISLDSEMTVGQATRALMDQAKENDNIQMLFVTAENGFFCGTVELRALLIAEKNAAIAPLIQHRFPYVYCSERTEDCIERLKSYSESAIPVLDASNCILGVITLKDLVEAVDDEMSDDYAKLGGLSAEEDLHEPLRASLKKRMPWLLVLLVLGMVVSGVVGAFEKVVSRLTIIMAFQSLILDMAGNVGTQSLAVTIRVLMDKEITARKKLGLVCKEMRVGLFSGLILGSLSVLFVGAYIMLGKGYPAQYAFAVSVCIGAALLLAMFISSAVGTLIPMFFKRIGVDPAVASGPLPSGVTPSVSGVSALSKEPNLRHSTVLPPPAGRGLVAANWLCTSWGLAFSSSSMP